MSDKKQDWRGTAHDRVCSACMNANPKMGNCKNDCLMHKLISSEISAAEKRGEERGRAKAHEENMLMVRQHGICTKEVCDSCKMCDKFYAALREDLKIAKDVEAAKYKAVVEAAKAFTSGGQAELCGACAYGRFNARKLSSALAALEGK